MFDHRRLLLVGALWTCAVVRLAAADAPSNGSFSASDLDHFEKRVRPLLAEHCYKCHGVAKQMSGLRADSRAALLKGGENGVRLVPAKPDEGGLLAALRHAGEIKMPPDKRLPPDAVEAIAEWIRRGAAWPTEATNTRPAIGDAAKQHWAFQPIRAPALPNVAGSPPPQTSLDAFVIAQLTATGNQLAPIADKSHWLRRVTFDLIGLPPTPDEAFAYLVDDAPDADQRVVDRLLASPRYGERWGRHWLDVARYADTKGYVIFGDKDFPWSYTYRDYVVRAFNEDLPFDEFILEQLAADLRTSTRQPASLAGLGFLTVGPRFIDNQYDTIDDRIDVVMRGLMGLTVACARCHDHKFDPIPTHDYYSLYGVFASCAEPVVPPLIAAPPQTDGYQEFDRELQTRVQKLQDFLREKHAAVVQGARRRVAEYLLAVHALQDKPRQDDFMLLADGNDLNPTMTLRWQSYLREAKKTSQPIFVPWFALAAIQDADFAQRLPATLAELGRSADAMQQRIVANLQAAKVSKLADVAAVYGQLFKSIDEAWEREQKANAQATALPDPVDEQLRQFLYAPQSPPQIPLHPQGDLELLPDRPSQGKWKELVKAIETYRAAGPHAPPRAMVLTDLPQPHEPRVFVRGNPNQPSDAVPRRFLQLLSGDARRPFVIGSGRLELAQAIVAADNPLTARVFVNRVWQKFFHRGLVATPSDFGLRSDPPAHPELLDHLAHTFRANGWSVKSLQRQVVLSATYRQASDFAPEPAGTRGARGDRVADANTALAPFPRRRLDFEALRDAVLFVAGTFDGQLGGPTTKDTLSANARRRTLYGYVDRYQLPGTLRAFDFPSPDTTSPQRDVTTVSPQSLFLMNHPLVMQNAARVLRWPEIAAEKDVAKRIEKIYWRVLARAATADEIEAAVAFVAETKSQPWERLAHALLMSNEFAYLD